MSDRGKYPKKYSIALSCKKWNVVEKSKYPQTGIIDEYIYGECVNTQKIIGYMKNDILCFYWGVGKSKFQKMSYSKDIIFMLYSDSFKKAKECIERLNYMGEIGFELTEFHQLNNVVQYMLKRNGYETIIKDGFLLIKK